MIEDNKKDKKMIFIDIFFGENNTEDYYKKTKVIILKQKILDDKIIEGFNYDFSKFGGNNKFKWKNNCVFN